MALYLGKKQNAGQRRAFSPALQPTRTPQVPGQSVEIEIVQRLMSDWCAHEKVPFLPGRTLAGGDQRWMVCHAKNFPPAFTEISFANLALAADDVLVSR